MLLQEVIVKLNLRVLKSICQLYATGTELYDVKLQIHLIKLEKYRLRMLIFIKKFFVL